MELEGASPKKDRKQYIQKYRNEWDNHPLLREWITKRANSLNGAFCSACGMDLVGSVTTFIKHGETGKHKRNMAQMKGESFYEVKEKLCEDDLNFKIEEANYRYSEIKTGDFSSDTPPKEKKPKLRASLPKRVNIKKEPSREVLTKVNYDPPSSHYLQGGFFNNTLRKWQSDGSEINAWNLMYPIFILDDPDGVQVVPSIPGISRYGVNTLVDMLIPLVNNGLTSVFLVGAISRHAKDARGSLADSMSNPVLDAIAKIKESFPHVTVACDVCLCNYTSHGHCCVIEPDGKIDQETTIERLVLQSLAYAMAGADIISPSDMMDGRILAIKNGLRSQGIGGKVSILSNSVKFASSLYEPYREAALCAPQAQSCDRKTYELPPGSTGLALRAVERDIKEGADMIMVKPANTYLDVISQINDKFSSYPIFAFQASGEYAMMHHAGESGVFNLKRVMMEILISMRRAGAEVVITFFAPLVLEWLKDKEVIIIRF